MVSFLESHIEDNNIECEILQEQTNDAPGPLETSVFVKEAQEEGSLKTDGATKNGLEDSNRKDSTLVKRRAQSELYKTKMRTFDEHYDLLVNEMLSDSLHRGDVVSSQRMLGYVDALMATCATFLVIPLRNLKEMKEGNNLSEHMHMIRFEILVFFLGYLVVLTIWESINIRTLFIKRVDDVILLLTISVMLLTTLLPFSLSLEGHYPGETISVWITCVLLGLVELLEIAITWYAMSHPSVLHLELQKWPSNERATFRNIVCTMCMINIVIIVLGSLSVLLNHVLAWAFIALLILMPLIRKLVFYIRRRTNSKMMEESQFFFYFSKGNISKERVVAMSDAAFAIIACILILDITVEEFPTRENVLRHGLLHELKHMRTDFNVYLAIFITVSILWYANHAVLHLFRNVNVVVLYLQKFFLALTCLCPLAGNMVTFFMHKSAHDSQLSALFASLVVFASSTCNVAILFYGLCTRSRFLHVWAAHEGTLNRYQKRYVIVKSINIPFWTLLCALLTFIPGVQIFILLLVCFLCAMTTIIVSKVIFTKKIGLDRYVVDETKITESVEVK